VPTGPVGKVLTPQIVPLQFGAREMFLELRSSCHPLACYYSNHNANLYYGRN